MKQKLKDVTFTLNSKPIRTLMWCDCVPKAKRNKPAKVNGILVGGDSAVTSQVQVYHEL
jgi:hypothetical protein